MKTQTIYVDACTSTGIAIGRRNTYATEQIVFGLAPLVQQYGAGSAVLMVLRPTDTAPYPAVTSQSGTELTWTVSATDTSVPGTGECELYWYVDGGLAKSVIFPLTIQRDIITEPIDEPPEPYQTWVDDLTELGAETLQNAQAAAQSATAAEAAKTAAQAAQTGAEAAKTAAQGAQAGAETARTGAEAAQTAAETAQGKAEDAQEAAESAKTDAEEASRQAEEALEEFTTPTASATTLEPDEEATASYANGHFTFGIPQGVQGQPGQPGQPGVTPDFSIGTIQTLQPSQPATASITGTAEHPVLNLGIPQGVQGDPATNLVQSVNGKTGAVVLDAGDIGYDGETTYPDASVGKELGTINSALTSLQSVTEIIDTASGAIASFPDGSGLPMRSLLAQIEPQQEGSGDPSPENVRPITGWTGLSGQRTGANLGEFTHGKGIDTGGHIHDFATRSATVTPIKIDSARQYKYVNSNSSNAGIYAVWSGETLVRRVAGVTSGTVMDTSGGDLLYVCGYSGDADVLPETCGVFFADQYEEFEPYTGMPITVSWQTEAGTVYGGTVDVVTGVLTVTHRYVLLDGTQTINKHSTTAYNGFHLNLANNGLPACASTEDGTVGQFSYYKLGKLINANGNAFVGANTIQFRNDSLTTKDEAIAYLTANPLQVVYPLAQPQTYQLTPQQISTLLGNNTVFVDTGSVSVTYQASIKGYIDKVLGQ